jgi:glycosyltransferase involved in cell wall biosynthesis
VRLLVDAQCVQSTSSLRGIGRYALCLTRALVQSAGQHTVEVLLNGGDDPARLLRARTALETFLPPRSVHVFDAPWAWTPPYDDRRRPAAEAAYAAAVRSLRPDALLIGSPFEGDAENVLSVRRTVGDPPTAAVLYDLIPALDPGTYLLGPGADIYWRRLDEVKRCGGLLAISRYSGQQAERVFGAACPPVTPVWGGPYPSGDFPSFEPQADDVPGLVLPNDFLLTVGGDHPRKNLDRLVQAWSQVPRHMRIRHPLVVACRLNVGTARRLRRLASRHGVRPEELLLTGGVSERRLHDLYAKAYAFVFPSVEEGLGMPPLEAMAAGCPTLLAQGSSLSELSDEPAAFFDGYDTGSMTSAILRVLGDTPTRHALQRAGARSASTFTWQRSSERAWAALEDLIARTPTASAPAGAPLPAPVPLSDSDGVRRTHVRPAPVLLDAPLPEGPLGVLGIPTAGRAALAGATALLAPDVQTAAQIAQAGILEHPVLLTEDGLDRAAAHDFYAEYAVGLKTLELDHSLRATLARAVASPPRWMLERPRSVWLLLTEEPVEDALQAAAAAVGVDLVPVAPDAGVLLTLADAVLLRAEDIPAKEGALLHARRRGVRVVALHQKPDAHISPEWCVSLALNGPLGAARSWEAQLAAVAGRWDRTTGWPWRAGR